MRDGGEKKTILAVDDAPENIDVLTGILKADFKIKVALNGEKALKIAGKAPPDLILLDVMMPGMDGFAVREQLQADPATAGIPVVFVTGEAPEAVEEKSPGSAGVLVKPVEPAVLSATLNECIRRREPHTAPVVG